MALIKCPECNKEVSTAATICPHCGYPINNSHKEDYPKPIDKSWTTKWKNKAKVTRRNWLIALLCSLVILGVFIILLCNDVEVTSSARYHKTIWAIFTGVMSFISVVLLIIWILSLALIRIRLRQFDEYTILVYVGFKQYLVVEDKIQDSGITNRYLYGELPNKKQVWVSISAIDGSVKMGVGQTGDEKQIL